MKRIIGISLLCLVALQCKTTKKGGDSAPQSSSADIPASVVASQIQEDSKDYSSGCDSSDPVCAASTVLGDSTPSSIEQNMLNADPADVAVMQQAVEDSSTPVTPVVITPDTPAELIPSGVPVVSTADPSLKETVEAWTNQQKLGMVLIGVGAATMVGGLSAAGLHRFALNYNNFNDATKAQWNNFKKAALANKSIPDSWKQSIKTLPEAEARKLTKEWTREEAGRIAQERIDQDAARKLEALERENETLKQTQTDEERQKALEEEIKKRDQNIAESRKIKQQLLAKEAEYQNKWSWEKIWTDFDNDPDVKKLKADLEVIEANKAENAEKVKGLKDQINAKKVQLGEKYIHTEAAKLIQQDPPKVDPTNAGAAEDAMNERKGGWQRVDQFREELVTKANQVKQSILTSTEPSVQKLKDTLDPVLTRTQEFSKITKERIGNWSELARSYAADYSADVRARLTATANAGWEKLSPTTKEMLINGKEKSLKGLQSLKESGSAMYETGQAKYKAVEASYGKGVGVAILGGLVAVGGSAVYATGGASTTEGGALKLTSDDSKEYLEKMGQHCLNAGLCKQ